MRHTDVMTRAATGQALSKAGEMGLGGSMRASLAALAVVAASSGTALASEPIGFLVCQPGGPKLSKSQTEVMDQLFRHLEKKMALENGRLQGRYENSKRGCDKAIAEKPGVLFPSVPIYLESKQTLKLKPVAQLRVNGKTRDNFYVLAKADTKVEVSGLAGKTIMGTHVGSPRFVSDVVFQGRLKPDQLKLKVQKRSLRAVRRVISGRAAAVVLDGEQYRALEGTDFGKKLRLVHTSPAVPTPPVTVVPGRVPEGFGRRLGEALVSMRDDPEGRKVLETFKIEGFDSTSLQQWAQLEARFNRP